MPREEESKVIVKRRQKRLVGIFIDGTGLDRATRRLNRRVDLSALIRGVSAGTTPLVARYYTLIPYEDDSRHRAFLDAVSRAGLSVFVKRLPPKGVSRQVSIDSEMSADIAAFAMGHSAFPAPALEEPMAKPPSGPGIAMPLPGGARPMRLQPVPEAEPNPQPEPIPEQLAPGTEVLRSVIVVCPSRDLVYAISLAREIGVDTVTADFGRFNHDNILKSAAKWIDLSDSETIWKD